MSDKKPIEQFDNALLDVQTVAWDDRIKELKIKRMNTARNLMYLHWEEGDFLLELSKTKKYGDRTIETYAKEMDISIAHANQCRKFREEFKSLLSVDELINKGIPWRNVVKLLSVTEPEKRAAVIEKAPELTTEEFEETVLEAAQESRDAKEARGEKVDKRGLNTASLSAKCVNNMIIELIAKLDDFSEAIDTHDAMPESKFKAELNIRLREGMRSLDKLVKKSQAIFRDKPITATVELPKEKKKKDE